MQEELDQIGTTTGETAETTPTAVEESASEESSTATTATEEKVPHRKVRTGVVVSDKMNKSIVVKVTRRLRHPLYKKYSFKSKKFMVHDENNECGIGDTVRIIETRPLSAQKRWRLDTILERAK